jgi:hypothetical protein
MKSAFPSRNPQALITEAELVQQEADYFARGKTIEVLPPQFFAQDQAEKQKYTAIVNGKAKSRGMQ